MSITIVDKDLGFKRIVREVNASRKSFVVVGFQGEEKEKGSKARVADIAIFNEFGTGGSRRAKDSSSVVRAKSGNYSSLYEGIPARPFVRTAFDRVESKIMSLIGKLYKDLLHGKIGTEKSLKIIGQYMKGQIQRQINMTLTPPNAPITKERKGSSHPLINTGQMRQSVSYTTHTMGMSKEYKSD
jgi:hypothetical protein